MKTKFTIDFNKKRSGWLIKSLKKSQANLWFLDMNDNIYGPFKGNKIKRSKVIKPKIKTK
jgi:hypothetical protein